MMSKASSTHQEPAPTEQPEAQDTRPDLHKEEVEIDGGVPLEASAPRANVRSLRDLIDRATGRDLWVPTDLPDAGLAESLPFPFLAIVGQKEMKLALLLALVNPAVSGVLLIGPRGTGKTTAVRSLIELLPMIPRSLCYYGCMPEDIEAGGVDAVCPDCARKYGQGEPLAKLDSARLVELPLNSQLDDVVGRVDERAAIHDRMRVRRGILAQADRNLLYVDEVNLLPDEVVDAILDAAAMGAYTVHRGGVAATYRARFALIGSMNPEEGRLRPQIMDRFGLRVVVRGLEEMPDRLEAYRRVGAYQQSPRRLIQAFRADMELAREEIQSARDVLPEVKLPDEVAQIGLRMVHRMHIDSLRSEITLFEATRAYAALDGRLSVTPEDIFVVAPMALRMRRSTFMEEYSETQNVEERELNEVLTAARSDGSPG